MKVLLTGAGGFVGRNVFNKLKDKYELIPIYGRRDCNLLSETECFDLLDEFKPDMVVHLAGTVGGIKANMQFPGDFIYENLKMGMNMIHMSVKTEVQKFILVGTVCSYPKHTTVPFREDDFWFGYPEETNAPYGVAKKALGEMLKAYENQFGMSGAYLVPANMYGPHDHFNLTSSHVIPALIMKVHQAILRKEKTITVWGTGAASREFLYAEDFADAIDAAINTKTTTEPINIGTGVETKIFDLINKIADIMGYDGDLEFNGELDGQPRRRLETITAETVLGFKAQTDLDTGLRETINWYKGKTK